MNWYWISDLKIVAKIHSWIIVLGLFFLMCSCFYVPALRDDYSKMRDDVFTETIIEVRKVRDSRLIIDKYTGREIGERFFENKNLEQVEVYFNDAGGVCKKSELDSETLLCELDRKWIYKNVGAYSDPSTWCEPGLRLMYKFHISRESVDRNAWSDLEFDAEGSGVCSFRGK